MSYVSKRNKSIAFMILIGGKSARFGTDKGIFEFDGKPLVSYQLEIISKFGFDIFLVANSQEQVQAYIEKIDIKQIMAFILDDMELVQDDDLHTPMIGLYSGFKELSKLDYEKVFTLSCDMPLIRKEIIDLFIKESKENDCCIPKWNNGFLEPLFAIYPIKEAYENSEKSLRGHSYKLIKILDNNWKINYISVENSIQPLDKKLVTFININGPIDLEKLIKIQKENE
jgi:molybdopterin-guanine dinucleotide biosynthesis protein A